MSTEHKEPPAVPTFRPHRLMPAPAALPGSEVTSALCTGQERLPWPEAPEKPFPPPVAEAAGILAHHIRLVVEQAMRTLEALPAVLGASGASEEVAQALRLLRVNVQALPDQVASGVDASVPRVDGLFVWLLNAPGRAGLIQQALDALSLPATRRAGREAASSLPAQMAALRGLHRDLVSLHQRWDDLVSALFPLEPFAPTNAPPRSGSTASEVQEDQPNKHLHL